jgi:hypothetical protein
MLELVVKPAQHTLARPGVIVLHKGQLQSGLLQPLFAECFHEKAASVAKDLRLEDQHTGQRGFDDFHRNAGD